MAVRLIADHPMAVRPIADHPMVGRPGVLGGAERDAGWGVMNKIARGWCGL